MTFKLGKNLKVKYLSKKLKMYVIKFAMQDWTGDL